MAAPGFKHIPKNQAVPCFTWNIRLFSLFTNTETAENLSQQVVWSKFTGDAIQ